MLWDCLGHQTALGALNATLPLPGWQVPLHFGRTSGVSLATGHRTGSLLQPETRLRPPTNCPTHVSRPNSQTQSCAPAGGRHLGRGSSHFCPWHWPQPAWHGRRSVCALGPHRPTHSESRHVRVQQLRDHVWRQQRLQGADVHFRGQLHVPHHLCTTASTRRKTNGQEQTEDSRVSAATSLRTRTPKPRQGCPREGP